MVRLIGFDGQSVDSSNKISEVLVRQFGFTRVQFSTPIHKISLNIILDGIDRDTFCEYVEITTDRLSEIVKYLRGLQVTVSTKAESECLALDKTVIKLTDVDQFVRDTLIRDIIGSDTLVNIWAREQAKHSFVVTTDAHNQNERDAITVRKGKNVLVKSPMFDTSNKKDSDYDAIVNDILSTQEMQSELAMWYVTIREKSL